MSDTTLTTNCDVWHHSYNKLWRQDGTEMTSDATPTPNFDIWHLSDNILWCLTPFLQHILLRQTAKCCQSGVRCQNNYVVRVVLDVKICYQSGVRRHVRPVPHSYLNHTSMYLISHRKIENKLVIVRQISWLKIDIIMVNCIIKIDNSTLREIV